MSTVNCKGESASAVDDKNMESIENREPITADHHPENISEIGSGDAKNIEKEGKLIPDDLKKDSIIKITEINPLLEPKTVSSETSLTDDKITSEMMPSTSKADDTGIAIDTNYVDTILNPLTEPILKITKSDDSIIEKTLQNQVNEKNQQVLAVSDAKMVAVNDVNESFDEELELKWDDDDEPEQGLSEEALKLLDQELGIDDIISTSEIESNKLENKNKDANNSLMDIINVNSNDDNGQLGDKIDVKDTTKASNEELTSQNTIEENPIKVKDTETNIDCIKMGGNESSTAAISTSFENQNDSVEKKDKDLSVANINESIAEVAEHTIHSTNTGNTVEVEKEKEFKLTSPIVEEVNIDLNIANSNEEDKEQSNTLIEKSITNEQTETLETIKNDTVENFNKEQNTVTFGSIQVIEITDETNKQELTELENTTTEDNLKNDELINTDKEIITEQDTIENEENFTDGNTDTVKQEESKGMKTGLGLNKPDVMIEIPTQELIDIDEFDEPFDVEKEMYSTEKEAEIKSQNDKLPKNISIDVTELTVTDIVNEKELSKADENKQCLNINTGDIIEKSVASTASAVVKSIETDLNPSEKPTSNKKPDDTDVKSHETDVNSADSTDVEPLDTNVKSSASDEISTESTVKPTETDVNSADTGVNPPDTDVKSTDIDVKLADTVIISANTGVKSADTDVISADTGVKLIEPDVKSDETKCDEQPSKCKIDENVTEEPEITDSLLAESSRTMDDDDDHDDDDSDDFDQDDESSNHMTAEHSEESNPPASESELAKDEDCEKEAAVPGDSTVEREEQADDIDEPGLDIVDEIDCEETDIAEEADVDTTVLNEDSLRVKSPSNIEEPTPSVSQAKERDSITPDKDKESILKKMLLKVEIESTTVKESPINVTKLPVSNYNTTRILSFVDLEESSDEDIQETNEEKDKPETVKKDDSIDITKDETSSAENALVKSKTAFKMTKLNTSEVSIKTGVSTKPPLIIPEITNVFTQGKVNKKIEERKIEEIYSLDSDSDGENEAPQQVEEQQDSPMTVTDFNTKCINPMCTTISSEQHYIADANTLRYYGSTKKRAICGPCLLEVQKRNQKLVDGIRNLTPLIELHMEKPANQLVEISDSESEDESEIFKECKEIIGENEANLLSDKLVDLINDVWQKFNMDDRLKDSEDYITKELQKLEDEGAEVNKLLDECQLETDKIRTELYATFYKPKKQLPSLSICDTPISSYTCLEKDAPVARATTPLRSVFEEPPAKKLNSADNQTTSESTVSEADKKEDTKSEKQDDDRDVSVVLLSAEAAPSELPPAGEIVRPALRPGMAVHAMRNAFGSWLRGKILDVLPKTPQHQYTNCRVKFDHNIKNPCKVLPARCIAYQVPCNVRMTIGTRVLALFRDTTRKESFYSGVVAEIPNPVNNYRYLVFFDDGYAQYVKHQDTRLVCESKSLVWEEVHPFIRDFVKDYLKKYPERPMVRLHAGQRLNTEWNGKWWTSKVLEVDASLAKVHFEEDDRTEWIYRGSTRLAPLYLELQAAERHRTRLPRSKAQFRTNMPYVEYMRSEEQMKAQQQDEILRRQRAVAKKSTTQPQAAPVEDKPDNVTSRVVYYTPKNAVKPRKMVPHACGAHCKRNDVLTLKELRTYNPLAKPLLSGWERILVRYRGTKAIMYRAPCGRRLRGIKELHKYLRLTESELPVDLFDFNVNTHCLAEFVLHKYNVMKKDLSHGKENVPVPCVNYYDDTLPEFCSYNTERTPTAGVPLNLDPEFLCGCDCEDDCEDKTKCACWKMTLEGARTIGLETPDVGYVYRRLPEPLPSGIYECNSRCKCKKTCLNRVAQQPLQLKLQVFKTLKRGWGIRALNDVPKGSFLCVYAGNLLTDATANLDGLNEGDEYLAELDYIEVVEQMKEGYEEDIPEADKKLDKKESKHNSTSENEEDPESDEGENDSDRMDDDFQPGYIGMGLSDFDKRLRKRSKKEKQKQKEGNGQKTDNCITISDDEEVREPSRFTAQAGMGDKEFISKYRSVRALFGEDEACYIMDAKVQGNIGRYLNHSCQPNVFVQNVFVDTHDPRFPWVAFFALSHIRAGTELTWNYNYDIGSVPGKVLYCYCGAANCRGRLL